MSSETAKVKRTLGQLLLGIFGFICGVSAIVGGQAGYKFGYASGANVRLGGAIFVVLSAWMIIDYLRFKDAAKKEPIQLPETTRGK